MAYVGLAATKTQLETRIRYLENQNSSLQQEKKDLLARISDLITSNNVLNQQISDIRQQRRPSGEVPGIIETDKLRDAQETIRSLERQLSSLKQQCSQESSQMDQAWRFEYNKLKQEGQILIGRYRQIVEKVSEDFVLLGNIINNNPNMLYNGVVEILQKYGVPIRNI